MSNEAMKNTGVKNEVGTALMQLAFHIKHHGINLNTIADCYEMTDSRQPQQVKSDVVVIKSAISASSSELQEIIDTVNNVVSATTNGGSTVENIDDLKAFLNQALPAWQAVEQARMMNNVFAQFNR